MFHGKFDPEDAKFGSDSMHVEGVSHRIHTLSTAHSGCAIHERLLFSGSRETAREISRFRDLH
jgi:hypothetical protein